MIGYILNYYDEAKRRAMPSGLLVTHPSTLQIIAVGKSPLTDLLVKVFKDGISYPALTKFYEKYTAKSLPRDLKSFETVGATWFQDTGLNMVKINIRPPLRESVPIAFDLSACYDDEPFEHIVIGAYDGGC